MDPCCQTYDQKFQILILQHFSKKILNISPRTHNCLLSAFISLPALYFNKKTYKLYEE